MQLILLAVYAVAGWWIWDSSGAGERLDRLLEHGFVSLNRPALTRLADQREGSDLVPITPMGLPARSVRLTMPACEPAERVIVMYLPCPGDASGSVAIQADRCTSGGVSAWRTLSNYCEDGER